MDSATTTDLQYQSGKICVAAGCSNNNNNGFSMHGFPKRNPLRRIWVNFVKTKRAKWKPTAYSHLCSAHFTQDSFSFRALFQLNIMGVKPGKVDLVKGAFPTIHSLTSSSSSTVNVGNAEDDNNSERPPPVKKRRVQLKRELARIVSENETVDVGLPVEEQEMTISPHTDSTEVNSNITGRVSCGCQTDSEKVPVLKVTKRSKRCQTNIKPTLVNAAVQTDQQLVVKKMVDKHQLVRPEYFTAETSSQPTEELEDIPSLPSSPLTILSQDSDDLYEPPTSPLCADEDEDRCLPINDQRTFIIFEHNLLELFQNCIKCGTHAVGKIDSTMGSSIKIRQDCSHCLFTREWFSQPFVNRIPAGNLLMSSAILFSGSLPTKAIRMFNFMNLMTISLSSYFQHQNLMLFPAVKRVWECFQADYITEVHKDNKPLVVCGDGRADTPGHSAKFGSYSLLDLERGVILDVELVQSNEVKSSCHMEKEGLIRCIKFINENNIDIVMPRRVGVECWLGTTQDS